MAKKSWTIQLEDGMHTVEMEHNLFSNKRTIHVDGEVAEQGKFSALDFGGDYPFPIGARQAIQHMRMNDVQYKYDISIDGHSALTGKPVTILQPMPKWAWLFVVGCVAIPVVENNILDGTVQGAVANVDGKLAKQQDFPLGTIPSREAEFDAPAQGAQPDTHVKVRYFLVNNRLYQVMVVVPQSQSLPAEAQKFLDSFKLIEY